jgi:hypothetical protein
VSRWVWLPQFTAGVVSGDVWLGLAKSGALGLGLGLVLAGLSIKGGPATAIRIAGYTAILELDNRVVAIARSENRP